MPPPPLEDHRKSRRSTAVKNHANDQISSVHGVATATASSAITAAGINLVIEGPPEGFGSISHCPAEFDCGQQGILTPLLLPDIKLRCGHAREQRHGQGVREGL